MTIYTHFHFSLLYFVRISISVEMIDADRNRSLFVKVSNELHINIALQSDFVEDIKKLVTFTPVSYTHLTLPTKA